MVSYARHQLMAGPAALTATDLKTERICFTA